MDRIRAVAAPPPVDPLPPTADTDAALVARARIDPAAFGLLYDRYADAVFRYCYRRLGTREAAEDATAQVFLRALGALPRYREGGTFAGWLFAIAHNAVADVHRRRPRELPPPPDLEDAAPSPEALALAAEEQAALLAAVRRLPPDQRRAVELRLAGLTGAEVGQAMGRSHRAAKMLQFRAITTLRRLLGVEPPREDDDHEQARPAGR